MASLTNGTTWNGTVPASNFSNSQSTSITLPTKGTYLDKNIAITIPKLADMVSAYAGSTGVTSTTKYCELTLDANDDSGMTIGELYSIGTAKAITANPYSREHYTFNGWNSSADGSGTSYTDEQSLTLSADKTIYGQWTIISYTITFNANGGSVSTSSKTLSYGSTYGDLPTPTRDKYNFLGWFTAAEDGSEVTSSSVVTGDKTVYAQWEKAQSITYTLTGIGSYGWTASTTTNPTSYTMYQSNNYNVSSSYAVMKITFSGYSSFTIYINSYAESSYDYTIASTLDASSYPTSTSSYAYANTSSKQYVPTTFNTTNWTTVTYTPSDDGEHYIYVVFRKDGSVNSNNDRGYVLINENQ